MPRAELSTPLRDLEQSPGGTCGARPRGHSPPLGLCVRMISQDEGPAANLHFLGTQRPSNNTERGFECVIGGGLIRREDSPCGQKPPPGVSQVRFRQSLSESFPSSSAGGGGGGGGRGDAAAGESRVHAPGSCALSARPARSGPSLQDEVACTWLGEYS